MLVDTSNWSEAFEDRSASTEKYISKQSLLTTYYGIQCIQYVWCEEVHNLLIPTISNDLCPTARGSLHTSAELWNAFEQLHGSHYVVGLYVVNPASML